MTNCITDITIPIFNLQQQTITSNIITDLLNSSNRNHMNNDSNALLLLDARTVSEITKNWTRFNAFLYNSVLAVSCEVLATIYRCQLQQHNANKSITITTPEGGGALTKFGNNTLSCTNGICSDIGNYGCSLKQPDHFRQDDQ